KRKIIGSIFPEKLVFDGERYRTARVNEAARLIYAIDKGFGENKTGQAEDNFNLSSSVPGTGFEPAHLAAPPPEDGASTNFATRAFPLDHAIAPVVLFWEQSHRELCQRATLISEGSAKVSGFLFLKNF